MALITYKEWLQKQTESSPQTRLMAGIQRGNYPPTASPFTHSTPSKAALDANEKALGKGKKRKHKKKNGGPSKKDGGPHHG